MFECWRAVCLPGTTRSPSSPATDQEPTLNRTALPVLLTLLACAALAGCAKSGGTTPPAELPGETVARQFDPVPDKSVIYLVRDRGDVWQFGVKVQLDGKPMGETQPMTYFRWEVAPGEHVIVSETTPPAVLELSTEPGGLYYVWQDINSGQLRAPSRLEQVDMYTAKETMATAVLLKSP
jgi:hypothetical protein